MKMKISGKLIKYFKKLNINIFKMKIKKDIILKKY